MKYLIIGNGGREDAIAWKLLQSKKISHIYMIPNSVRKDSKFSSYNIKIDEHQKIVNLALKESIDIVIIGPEIPLCAGLSDLLRENNIKVFGPSKEAAQLEGSKSFAKQIMKDNSIPTALSYETTNYDEAVAYIKNKNMWPIVIKADGLAAGKGVLIAKTLKESKEFLRNVLEQNIFQTGQKVVIEEFLEGVEFSLMAFVNETGIYPMKVVRDYKKSFDNDEGLNTGGMGVITTLDDITEKDIEFGVDKIIKPTIQGLKKRNIKYEGVIYAGLIKTKDGIFTIEFNVRLGDPETEGIMPIIENDFGELIEDLVNQKPITLRYNLKSCIGVVIAKKGYPCDYSKGAIIKIPNNINYFNMGITYNEKHQLVSNGGRVLLVYELANSIQEARENIYKKLKLIENDKDFFFRKDIGKEQ